MKQRVRRVTTTQVAHVPPETIIVFGEGIFHHLTFSLPRANEKGNNKYIIIYMCFFLLTMAILVEFAALLKEAHQAIPPPDASPRGGTDEFSPRTTTNETRSRAGSGFFLSLSPFLCSMLTVICSWPWYRKKDPHEWRYHEYRA